MQTISDIVENIIDNDTEAQSAARNGYLDVPAYASLIKSSVAKNMFKEVNQRTLAITINRIIKRKYSGLNQSMTPKLVNISVHTDLIENTYEKNRQNLIRIADLAEVVKKSPDKFFTVTQSNNELTIIAEAEVADKVAIVYKSAHTLYSANNLCGVSVKFSIKYLEQPNIIFELTKRLANKFINVIEVVSTTTELTFIVNKCDTDKVVLEMTKLL